MPPAELVIVTLVYVAALVLGQRATALAAPAAQEIGFAIAAIAGSVTAALLYQRRARQRAPTRVKLVAGAVMGAAAVAIGMLTYLLWQSTLRPAITLPIASVATVAAPFAVFPLVRRLTFDALATGGPPAPPLGEMHVVLTAAVATAVLVASSFIYVPGRSNVRLVGKSYPSLFIGLPEWEAEQNAAMMEFGSIKLRDPRSAAGDRFLAVRWMDSDPVQADDHVQTIAVGGLVVRDRSPAFVSRHEGTTYYLESDDRVARAVATVWNCPQDHRVLWIFSYLAGPKSAMLATHQEILRNVHCHRGGAKSAAAAGAAAGAATQRVFPSYAAPPGFAKRSEGGAGGAGGALAYDGANGAEIAFDAGLSGRSDIVSESVTPDVIAKLLTNAGILQRVEGAPALTTVNDMQGHQRRIWSVAGIGRSRDAVQMEVMIWYCDRRNMTFIGRYATPGRHEVRNGINALLPAACHSE